jgi:hypothetical protein
MFTKTERSLLIGAKDRIASGKDRFLCCAINEEMQAVADDEYNVRYASANNLKEAIEFSLDHLSVFELWLFSETGIYPIDISPNTVALWEQHATVGWKRPVAREAFEEICRAGRVAWVDRALETGSLL